MLDYCIMDIRDVDEATIRYYTSIMSAERQKAIQQYPSEPDRIRSVIGEMATRKLLSKHTCMPEKDILLCVGKNGKPLAKNINLEFNVSHSENYILCAVSESPLGADIETLREYDYLPVLRFFSPRERAYILEPASDESKKLARFFEVWTFKEAYVKKHAKTIASINESDFFDSKIQKYILKQQNYIATIVI